MNISIVNNNNNKYIAWGISIIIHLILLLLFILIKYNLPAVPSYQEDYLEVALGTDEEGFGDEVPEWRDAPAPLNPSSGSVTAHNEDHHIETTDHAPDQVKINSRTTQSRPVNEQRTSTTRTTPNRQAATNADSEQADTEKPAETAHRGRTFTGTGPGGNLAENNTGGTGRGNNPGSGQSRGTPGGNPQGTDIVPRSRLEGRKIAQYPPPKAKYNEKGLVKIQVWVNRQGNVVRHTILSSPSASLSRIAVEKLKQTRFNESKNAPDPQTGTIEFNFNVK